jgi:hypothetical protein
MSFNAQGEWIDDGSGYVSVAEWCPRCAPDGIPEPWTMRLCNLHTPRLEGSADLCVRSDTFLSGTAEAGGPENRAFCDFLRSKSS